MPTFQTVGPVEFYTALQWFARRRPDEQGFLTWRSPEDMEGMHCVLSEDSRTGVAIHQPSGDIRNVFNYGEPGLGARAVAMALSLCGGVIVDAFDNNLGNFYRDLGFIETQRWAWNDEFRPAHWNEAKYGKPDVIAMRHPEPRLTINEHLVRYRVNRQRRKGLRLGSLFSGIGGMALAARWVGWETSFFAEVDPYASAVLAKNFPGVPNYGDVRAINGQAASVDILTGGFPCQDISNAGKRAGIAGERSGLWKEFARLIGEFKPKYALAENVSALRGRGLDVVLSDLDALGYDAEWHCIPASRIGAPHQRDRIWIIAHSNTDSKRQPERTQPDCEPIESEFQTSLWRHIERFRYPVANSNSNGLEGGADSLAGEGTTLVRRSPRDASGADARRPWVVEPDVGRVAHGVPSRVDRLRCLGNTIVPQIPLLIFQAIQERERAY